MDRMTGGTVLAVLLTTLLSYQAGDGRHEFYAGQVVDHIDVADPENALGVPDGMFAEIRPGGEMTLEMEEPLVGLDGSDDGRIVMRNGTAFGLAGLFPMDEEGSLAWQPLSPGSEPGGFNLGPLRDPTGRSTRTIRIINDDDRPLFLDAVIGFGPGEKPGKNDPGDLKDPQER